MTVTPAGRVALLTDCIDTCTRVATLARDGSERGEGLASIHGSLHALDLAGLLRLVADLADAVGVIAIAVRSSMAAGERTQATAGGVTGLVLKTDGTVEERRFSTLTDYQKAVGGSITGVYLSDGSVMYLDDEGLYKQIPHNALAMKVVRLGAKHGEYPNSVLVGDAVLVGPADAAGEDTSVTELAREWVAKAVR